VKIACLGWGSLIWDRGDLPVRDRKWSTDGPVLPVEFARESNGRRITLVIVPDARRVAVLWCLLDCETLDVAVRRLAEREDVDLARHPDYIGAWPGATGNPSTHAEVGKWAVGHGLDAVVWTDLPPGMKRARGLVPSADTVVAHLKKLEGGELERAREYIERAPAQVDTEYRRRIRAELGWGIRSVGQQDSPRSPPLMIRMMSSIRIMITTAAHALGRVWGAILSVLVRRRDRLGEVVMAPPSADVGAALLAGCVVLIGTEGAEKWIRFLCPCGCGDVIALNLMASYRPRWHVTRNPDATITVEPSVVSTRCGSHFWVRSSRVVWV